MEFTNVHLVALYGLLIGLVFGAVANKTNFCTMGAISDWVNMGSKGRLGAWLLAMGIAIIGAQCLELTGLVDLSSTMYRSAVLSLPGYIIGGLLFGIGMTLAGGCGQRSLVRFGNGNLKSLVVVLILGITAYMTVRGIFGLVRVGVFDPYAVNLGDYELAEQGIAAVLLKLGGSWTQELSANRLRWIVALTIGFALIFYAICQQEVRSIKDNIIAGVIVGALIIASWFVTGFLGLDDFDPVPVEGLTFVAPTGNSINYLMTFTGSTISFSVAVVFGIILGAFFYGIATESHQCCTK